MSAPKMLPALLGGLFIGVLSSLPYIKGGNICCCLWVVSGGALAAWLMQQNTPRPITVGEGALVGLLSGLAGTLVWVVLAILGMLLFSTTPFDMADFQRAMSEGRDVPPEAREALENLSPAVMLVVGGVIWAVVSMVFATVGGLLGALMFRRKGGPTSGLPTAPPPTFTPPTFTPPAPVAPPPPFMPPPPSPPPPPPMDVAPPAPTSRRRPPGRRSTCRRRAAGRRRRRRPGRRRRADDHDPGPRPDPAAVAEAARSAGAAIRRGAASRPRARVALTAVTAPEGLPCRSRPIRPRPRSPRS